MATNKKNNILWWLVGGGAIIYLISKLTPEPLPSPPQDAGSGTPAPNTDYPIVYNKYSAKAKLLQAAVKVKQDGIVGPMTLAALKFYFPTFTLRFKINNDAELNYMINTINTKRNTYTNTNSNTYDRAVNGLGKYLC